MMVDDDELMALLLYLSSFLSPPFPLYPLSLSLLYRPIKTGVFDWFLAGEGRSALPLVFSASNGGKKAGRGMDRPEVADPPSLSLLIFSFLSLEIGINASIQGKGSYLAFGDGFRRDPVVDGRRG